MNQKSICVNLIQTSNDASTIAGRWTKYTKYDICGVIWYFMCLRWTFRMTLLMNKVSKYCHGWWMSSSMGQNHAFFFYQLVMRYCHGWLRIWMQKHLVSDSNCQHYKSIFPPKEFQGMLGYLLVLATLRCGLRLVMSKTMRIGYTKYYV